MALLARASANVFQISNNCYSKLTFISYKLKFSRRYLSTCFSLKRDAANTRLLHTDEQSTPNKNEPYVPFEELMAQRRDEARRSILVQVQSKKSCAELYGYCTKFGNVKGMYHYNARGSAHFFLVEFQNSSDVDSILSVASHTNVNEIVPVRSSMLWFKALKNNVNKSISKELPLAVKEGSIIPTSQVLDNLLLGAESVTDQMLLLHNVSQLDDVGTRLRYLTAHQLERCFFGMFPNISVLPFGSSVNGFGKLGCDLDLVLRLDNEVHESAENRLVYHAKAALSNERAQAQRIMETIGDVMQQLLPGVSHVRRILQARVPIIKYNQTLTALECDLSMTNMTAVYMSELLFLYGGIDWRVRPLTFAVKKWAQCVGLTNDSPGRWISNFSLTLLVLFFLQQKQILPSLNNLVKLASKNDVRLADDGVNCTFLRDITRLPNKTANTDNLEVLLQNFFDYYSNFDFSAKAVSLNDGLAVHKPEHAALYISNPLERTLNVSKNVSIEETERFRIALRNAAWQLEISDGNKSTNWGLLSIFYPKGEKIPTGRAPSNRIVDVSSLFDDKGNTKINAGVATRSRTHPKNRKTRSQQR